MTRHRHKDGATTRRPHGARVSDEQAARLTCEHRDETPAWARAAIDGVWTELRFGFAVDLSRGRDITELGAAVVDVEMIPGGLAIDPEGGILGLSVGREKLRMFATEMVDEAAAARLDGDPGPDGVWMVVCAVGERALVSVRLVVTDAASAEAGTR